MKHNTWKLKCDFIILSYPASTLPSVQGLRLLPAVLVNPPYLETPARPEGKFGLHYRIFLLSSLLWCIYLTCCTLAPGSPAPLSPGAPISPGNPWSPCVWHKGAAVSFLFELMKLRFSHLLYSVDVEWLCSVKAWNTITVHVVSG